MSALRVARAATGRNKILKFDGCYHGHADSLLVKAGSGLAGLAGVASSDSAGVSQTLASETLIAELDDEASVDQVFKAHGHEIAAVIIEPLPANYGLLIQRKEFLQHLAQKAKANGSLLIFDEVISGFRVALGGMAEVLGMKPDLVTYGKVIGGGFPVGCYGGRREIMDLVAPAGPVYQAGTLSANPVGMRAGLATLKKAESENVYAKLEARAARFVQALNSGFQKKGLGLEVERFGSIFWIHRSTNGQTIRCLNHIPKDHAETFKGLFHHSADQGIYLAPSGYEVGFVGYAHTDAILDEAAEKILKAAELSFGDKNG
jgi:glutamate-1-semialdehyde 2,1-aminomutase